MSCGYLIGDGKEIVTVDVQSVYIVRVIFLKCFDNLCKVTFTSVEMFICFLQFVDVRRVFREKIPEFKMLCATLKNGCFEIVELRVEIDELLKVVILTVFPFS